MKACRLASCLWFGAAFACAQNASLEIRGTVVEAGFGVVGATVTLFEFGHEPARGTTRSVFASTITDPRGDFRFQPKNLGEYYLEVKKEGYFNAELEEHGTGSREAVGDSVSLDRDHPTREFRFSITRLGELRGRVLDENGKPLTDFRVLVHPPGSSLSQGWEESTTDQGGYFIASRLKPGDYLVRIAPQRASLEILPHFTETDLKTVDQDLETSEWPGGGDERSAVPVPVGPGGSLSVGTITVRKGLYYRAHVSVLTDDCVAGENWNFSAIPSAGSEAPFVPTLDIPCTREFLVRNLRPGSYLFALSGRVTEKNRWAAGPAEITRENIAIALKLSPGTDVDGRVMAVDDAVVPALDRVRITVLPEIQGFADFALFGTRPVSLDSRGRFHIKGLQGDHHRVLLDGLDGKYYVKEIRYGGLPAVDGIITTAPSSPAEVDIVVDDNAACIDGLVTDGDKPAKGAIIMVLKWPLSVSEIAMPFLTVSRASTDDQGRFRIDGLAPREYGVLALPREAAVRLGAESLNRLLNRSEKISVARGSSQSVSLKIVEP